MKDSHTRLRDKWVKDWIEKYVVPEKQNEVDGILLMTIQAQADFFLSHFSTELESIRREIEGKLIDWEWVKNIDNVNNDVYYYCSVCNHLKDDPECGHICELKNTTIQDISLLLSNRIQK